MSDWPGRPPQYPTSSPAIPYALPQTAGVGRPGILSAVGTLSIILGSLGILTNIFFLLQAFMFSQFATSGHKPATSSVTSVNRPTKPAGEYISQNGIGSADRQIIIEGLSRVRPLTAPRRERVDALLADAGKKMFHYAPGSLSPVNVAAGVTKAQAVLSTGDDLFFLGLGKLQVNDKTAIFTPKDAIAPIRSEVGGITDSNGTHLANVQIDAVVARVQVLCNNAMNQTQIDTLHGQLESSTQQIIKPSNSVAGVESQVQAAEAMKDGTIGLTTDNNIISIGSNGEIAPGIMPAAGYSPNGKRPTAPRSATTGMFLDAIVSSGAASFLLVCGILMLKNSPNSRRFHLIYAFAKIPLSIAGAIAMYVVYTSIFSSTNTTTQNSVVATSLTVVAVFAGLGVIYPIALLLVMFTRGVRDFYNAPTIGRVY